MKQVLFFLVLFSFFKSNAFEGIIHCKKIENGVETLFNFYVKGSQIAVQSMNTGEFYKVIYNRSEQVVYICLDNPQLPEKGYYVVKSSDLSDYKKPEIYFKREIDPIVIDGISYPGYAINTEIGSAQAYLSSTAVNLSGFSQFFRDPLYELIDAFNMVRLPHIIQVQKSTSSYSIQMEAEEVTVESSIFEIPQGYKQFVVSSIGN